MSVIVGASLALIYFWLSQFTEIERARLFLATGVIPGRLRDINLPLRLLASTVINPDRYAVLANSLALFLGGTLYRQKKKLHLLFIPAAFFISGTFANFLHAFSLSDSRFAFVPVLGSWGATTGTLSSLLCLSALSHFNREEENKTSFYPLLIFFVLWWVEAIRSAGYNPSASLSLPALLSGTFTGSMLAILFLLLFRHSRSHSHRS